MSEINLNRLAKDIKNILRDPIENIFYKHDDDNILKGYAMIIGPKDTPYEYGYYFFEFNFPQTYPFLPPVVKYYTNDGSTRFNPNFYTCGKVCLSILNTWKGDGWTSCQNIRSVLLTLQSTLNDKPLCNEPGIYEKHKDFCNYNNMIIYKNIEVAIIGMISKKYLDKKFYIFEDIIVKTYKENKQLIRENLNKLSQILDDNSIQKLGIYVSEYLVNFTYLNKLLNKIDNIE
tara:strand:+ start:192 stop:884 length:693 start_codon:yes stop_codon:yes gene_type:complete